MEVKDETSQVMGSEQHYQELRQRINDGAASLVKMGFSAGINRSGIAITLAVVFVAIIVIVAVEVYSYMKNDFWGFNIWLCAFVGAALVVERIITMIMRHYLSRMKDAATTALQHYQALMRLIRAHKLRCWFPFAAGVICSLLVKHESDSWTLLIIISSSIVLGVNLGSMMRKWYLDDDFCSDVDELRDLVDIKGK